LLAAPSVPMLRRDPAGQLEVAGRIVHDRHVVLLQEADLLGIDVDTMRGNRPGPEYAQPGHTFYYFFLVLIPALFGFLARFENVNLERHIVLHGQVRARPQNLVRARVGRVRRDRWHDQRVALPFLDKPARIRQAFVVAFRVRRGQFHDRLSAHGAQPGLGNRRRDLGFVVVHVTDNGGPALDHFRT
jgi:hypothetical protein